MEKKAPNAEDRPKQMRRDAILAMASYMKEHHLDPNKDYSNHPEHGKVLNELYQKIRIAEHEIINNQRKLIKPEVHRRIRTMTDEEAQLTALRKYDYPTVDGKPMSEQMKKKYRAKMRSLMKSKMDETKAREKAIAWAQRWNNVDHPEEKVMRRANNGKPANAKMEFTVKRKSKYADYKDKNPGRTKATKAKRDALKYKPEEEEFKE